MTFRFQEADLPRQLIEFRQRRLDLPRRGDLAQSIVETRKELSNQRPPTTRAKLGAKGSDPNCSSAIAGCPFQLPRDSECSRSRTSGIMQSTGADPDISESGFGFLGTHSDDGSRSRHTCRNLAELALGFET